MAKTGYVGEIKGITFEKVREEPPQKCRKIRVGTSLVVERDVEGVV